MADYIAERVNKTFKRGGSSRHNKSKRRKLTADDEEIIENEQTQLCNEEPLHVMDCFGGVGGNVISFAKKCGFCVGVDLDPIKVDFIRHNAGLYDLKEPS